MSHGTEGLVVVVGAEASRSNWSGVGTQNVKVLPGSIKINLFNQNGGRKTTFKGLKYAYANKKKNYGLLHKIIF